MIITWSDDLQLSGTENVHLNADGVLSIYGIKIADTEAEHKQEVVGIQYPPEFAIQLLDFLKRNEDALMEGCGADIPSAIENPDFDEDKYYGLDEEDEEFVDEDDEELGADPYAPGYDSED